MFKLNLSKWYGDAVWPGGSEILYRARLGLPGLCYTSRIVPGRRSIRAGFWLSAAPVRMPDGVVFPPSTGACARQWHGVGMAPMVLFEDRRIRVEWEIVVGNGSVVGEGVPAEARGYAERLELLGGPWHLGLNVLHWGRFCGQRHGFVWIAWGGRINRSWCFLDGLPRTGLRADPPSCVQAQGLRLDMFRQESLVDASIGRSIGPTALPGAAGRFLTGRERKWTTLGRLTGDIEDTGHVLCEVVQWH